MKLEQIASSNKMERGSWNNFNYGSLVDFVEEHGAEFVDLTDKRQWNYWQNCEDTAVLRLPSAPTWDMAVALHDLHADEVDYTYDGNHHVIFRLWWD